MRKKKDKILGFLFGALPNSVIYFKVKLIFKPYKESSSWQNTFTKVNKP